MSFKILKKLFKIDKRKNWDKLSIHEKVEILKIDTKSKGNAFLELSFYLCSLSVTFFLSGLAIFYPYLARASVDDARVLTSALFKNSGLLFFAFVVCYFVGMGFMIYEYYKKMKVFDLD